MTHLIIWNIFEIDSVLAKNIPEGGKMNVEKITDGYSFERLVLGCSCTEVCKKVKNLFKNSNFKKAVRIVRNIQGDIGNWDPHSPKTDITKILFNGVKNKIAKKFHPGKLSLYSSVGTLLDYKYGIDFFFVFKSKECKEVMVTIDLTISEGKKKRHKHKADFVLTLNDLKNDRYIYVIDKIAVLLVTKTKKQIHFDD